MTESNPPANPGPPPTAAEVRAALRGTQHPRYTRVRHVAVQLFEADPETGSRSSTAAAALSQRKHRALVLYLLLLTAWPRLEHREHPYESIVWVRALSSSHKRAPTWSATTLSRAWADLEQMGLVARERDGRLMRVTPRREDGKADYTKPKGGKAHDERYFTVPDAFWDDEWFARLDLPALVVLLVILRETNGTEEVHRTQKQFSDWYGISERSAATGIKQLRDVGLLAERIETEKEPLSKTGWTARHYYSLTGDFAFRAREAKRKQARRAVKSRETATSRTRKPVKKPKKKPKVPPAS